MELTSELLLTYQGKNGYDGLCHVRVYEEAGQLPVVLAGALSDNPGTMLQPGIEMVAAAIQQSLFEDGREFRLIEYHPSRGGGEEEMPRFMRVHFEHRKLSESPDDPGNYAGMVAVIGEEETAVAHGRQIEGDFRDPRWDVVGDIENVVGCEVQVWPVDEYTALALGGEEGERLRAGLAENAKRRSEEIVRAVEGE
jgi:hypothetical protein